VSINISDSDNSSNVLLNSSFSGDTTISEPVPTANVSDTFLVQIEATKSNGETVTVSRLISSDSLQTPGGAPIDDDWKAIFSMVGLVVLGGLFSRANAGVGAVVVASVGGMLWLAGWMPAAASGITVAVALVVAGLAYALSRRSV